MVEDNTPEVANESTADQPAKRAPRRRASSKTTAPKSAAEHVNGGSTGLSRARREAKPAEAKPAKAKPAKKAPSGKKGAKAADEATPDAVAQKAPKRGRKPKADEAPPRVRRGRRGDRPTAAPTTALLFKAPDLPTLPPREAAAASADSETATAARRRTRRRSGEAPREGEDAPGTVVRVRQPRQQPAPDHRAAARQGLDPSRGQEAASPRRT